MTESNESIVRSFKKLNECSEEDNMIGCLSLLTDTSVSLLKGYGFNDIADYLKVLKRTVLSTLNYEYNKGQLNNALYSLVQKGYVMCPIDICSKPRWVTILGYHKKNESKDKVVFYDNVCNDIIILTVSEFEKLWVDNEYLLMYT